MGKTLTEIVGAAINTAEQNIKLASAQDAAAMPDPGDFLAGELGELKVAEEGKKCPDCGKTDCSCPASEKKSAQEKTSAEQILDDAAYGMKLAQALENAMGVVGELNKVAMPGVTQGTHHHTAAPGPQVFQSERINEQTQSPKAQTSTVPANQASHGGGPTENSQGYPNGIETNKKDYSDPNWTKNKEASVRLIRAKIAQAESLERMGQLEAAEQILRQANELQEKLAADPSSPQATLPAHNTSFMLDTEPPAASHVPDNAGMISLTRAKAKDPSTRETTQFFSEPPKKDNAVAAHVATTEGQKISHIKIAQEFRGQVNPYGLRGLHESEKFQGGMGAVAGGLTGAALGAGSTMSGKKALVRGLAGGALGAGAGAGLGILGAKGNQAIYRMVDKETQGRAAAREAKKGKEKKSELDQTQVAAARAYLKKIAAQANDPTAPQEEREKAASLIAAVRSRTAQKSPTPEELLS